MRKILAAACALLVVSAVTAAASAGPRVPVYAVVSGPAAQFHGYAPPVIVTQPGGQVTYVNADIAMHNVVQDTAADGVAGPNKKPWCKTYKKGQCPVFWTPQIGIGEETEVLGLESVKAGETYTFFCTLHESMRGTLVVAP